MKFQDAIFYAVKKFTSVEFIKRIKEEDESMIKHLNVLKNINNHGYITIESQAGKQIRGQSKIDGTPYIINERAYILGFMLESTAHQFIKNIALYTDKNAIFIPFCEDNIYIPKNLDIPLTTTEQNGKINVNTHASSALPYSVWESYRKSLKINKTEKIVFIFCWDSKWNRNASTSSGLFNNIEKIIKMKP